MEGLNRRRTSRWTAGRRGWQLPDRLGIVALKSITASINCTLGEGVAEFETGMRACLKAPDAIPAKPYAMFLSLSYNIGTGAFCRSTVARRANAGDIRGACNAIPLFNRAGGKVIKGLVNRRAAEQRVCLEGI